MTTPGSTMQNSPIRTQGPTTASGETTAVGAMTADGSMGMNSYDKPIANPVAAADPIGIQCPGVLHTYLHSVAVLL